MSNQLPYRLEIDNRRAVVALLPELNEVPWADIEKVGSEILARIQPLSSPALLVDLCALNYMGSAQVALVVRMFKTVKEKNGKMVVANRDPMVLEVLSLAGLNKVWTIVDSRERAMSMLGGGAIRSSSSGGSGGGGGMQGGDANPLPGMVALSAAVVAAVFVVLHLANPALIPSRGDLFGILGGSAVAFLCGFWAMSGNRNLGIGVIVVSVAMLLYGVFELAKPPGAAPAAPATEDKQPDAGATSGAAVDKPTGILPAGGLGTGAAGATVPNPGAAPANPPPGVVPGAPGAANPAANPAGALPPATTQPGTPPGTPNTPPATTPK